MRRDQAFLLLIILSVGMTVDGEQTIYWKKDRIYAGPGGKEIAIVTPPSSDATVPTTPTGLSSSNLTATSIQLNWTGSTDSGGSGLAGYKIYRQRGSGAILPVGTVGTGTLSFVDRPLLPSTSYTWTIIAFDAAQNHSAASTGVSVTTSSSSGDATAPDVPMGLQGQGISTSIIRLEWLASTDAGGSGLAGYEVYRSGTLISGGSPIATTSFEDTGRTANTSYSYTVKAVDGQTNRSAATSAVSVTTKRTVLFSDDFNRVDAANLGATWSYASWALSYNTAMTGYSAVWQEAINATSRTDFRATVSVLKSSAIGAGIAFWGNGFPSQHRYRAYMTSGGYVVLTYFDNAGAETGLAWVSAGAAQGTLTVEAVSSTRTIKVYVNGTLKITFTDTDTSRANTGYVGLTTWNNGSGVVVFDDFILEQQ